MASIYTSKSIPSNSISSAATSLEVHQRYPLPVYIIRKIQRSTFSLESSNGSFYFELMCKVPVFKGSSSMKDSSHTVAKKAIKKKAVQFNKIVRKKKISLRAVKPDSPEYFYGGDSASSFIQVSDDESNENLEDAGNTSMTEQQSNEAKKK